MLICKIFPGPTNPNLIGTMKNNLTLSYERIVVSTHNKNYTRFLGKLPSSPDSIEIALVNTLVETLEEQKAPTIQTWIRLVGIELAGSLPHFL